MYFISGFVSFLFGLLMIFFIKLFSLSFSKNVVDGNGNESVSNYFQFDVMIYPVVLIILGIILISVHFFQKNKA